MGFDIVVAVSVCEPELEVGFVARVHPRDAAESHASTDNFK